jgi:hypothetical protein
MWLGLSAVCGGDAKPANNEEAAATTMSALYRVFPIY